MLSVIPSRHETGLEADVDHRENDLPSTLFGDVAVRAMADALYQRTIDRCWKELRRVFERPDVIAAENVIMRAIAEQFCPAVPSPEAGEGRHPGNGQEEGVQPAEDLGRSDPFAPDAERTQAAS